VNFHADTVYETNLSASSTEASQHPRISRPDGDQERTQSAQPSPQGRTQTANCQRRAVIGHGRGGRTSVRQTLRKSETLRGYRSFTTIISNGTLIVARPVRLYYVLEAGSSGHLQIGYTVSRNVKGAVLRNRIKRVLREAVRLHKGTLVEALRHRRHRLSAVLLYAGQNPTHRGAVRLASVEQPVAELLRQIGQLLADRT